MKKIIVCLIFPIILLSIAGCKTNNVDGIVIGETLLIHQSYKQNRELKGLILKVLDHDKNAVSELIMFPNGGGEGSYNLGYVITQVIHRIGEKEFIELISGLSDVDLNILEDQIAVGLEYGDNDSDGIMDYQYIEDVFPQLNRIINEKL